VVYATDMSFISYCAVAIVCCLFTGILLASGVPHHQAVNAIRLSVGRETTTDDIDIAVKDLKNSVKTLSCNSSP
jgi:cysteine sulfinate desulfinase/cysteine desulfurase-like protein